MVEQRRHDLRIWHIWGGATAPCGLAILYIILCRSCIFCLYPLLSFSFFVLFSHLISFFSFPVGMSGFVFSIFFHLETCYSYVVWCAFHYLHCIGSRKWNNARIC